MTEEETLVIAVILAVLLTLLILAYYIGGIAILKKAGLRQTFRGRCLFALKTAALIAALTVVTYLITLAVKR